MGFFFFLQLLSTLPFLFVHCYFQSFLNTLPSLSFIMVVLKIKKILHYPFKHTPFIYPPLSSSSPNFSYTHSYLFFFFYSNPTFIWAQDLDTSTSTSSSISFAISNLSYLLLIFNDLLNRLGVYFFIDLQL